MLVVHGWSCMVDNSLKIKCGECEKLILLVHRWFVYKMGLVWKVDISRAWLTIRCQNVVRAQLGDHMRIENEDSFKDEKKFEQRNIYDQTNQILCGLYYMKSSSMTFMLCSCEDVGAPTSTILYLIIFLYPWNFMIVCNLYVRKLINKLSKQLLLQIYTHACMSHILKFRN